MSAMMGAIEIYNKPRFTYRDEVFVILVINAWELLSKAIVSKSGGRIYYPKKRGEPYRTLSADDAFWRAANSKLWPLQIEKRAVEANIDLLSTYRDNAIHFYNDASFGTIIYSLAQTSILNYRDVAASVFGKDIADEMSWRIMPLGVKNPIDPIKFMKGAEGALKPTKAVQDFLSYLQEKTDFLEGENLDTTRLLTLFDVALQSVKKIDRADIVVGVTSEELAEGVVVSRRVDPNLSHPYRQKELLPLLPSGMTSHTFQAIVYAHNLKQNAMFCWDAKEGNLTRWSPEVVKYITRLTADEVGVSLSKYRTRPRVNTQKRGAR